MSDYTNTFGGAAKDSANSTILGSEMDTELNNVQNMSTTKANKAIVLKVGSNSITIDQKGVVIKGMMVSIQGTVKAELKSPLTDVKGDGMLKLKGGMVMIN